MHTDEIEYLVGSSGYGIATIRCLARRDRIERIALEYVAHRFLFCWSTYIEVVEGFGHASLVAWETDVWPPSSMSDPKVVLAFTHRYSRSVRTVPMVCSCYRDPVSLLPEASVRCLRNRNHGPVASLTGAVVRRRKWGQFFVAWEPLLFADHSASGIHSKNTHRSTSISTKQRQQPQRRRKHAQQTAV